MSNISLASRRFVVGFAVTAVTVLGWGGNASAVISSCMDDLAPINLNCTANDFVVNIIVFTSLDHPCRFIDETITATGYTESISKTQDRYDIGVFLNLDGGDSAVAPGQTPTSCSATTLSSEEPPPFSLTDGDSCPDAASGGKVFRSAFTALNIVCKDRNNDGVFDFAVGTSWDNWACLTSVDTGL